MLTNAMNGPMICILSGSSVDSVDWSTQYTCLVTMNGWMLQPRHLCFKNQKQQQRVSVADEV